MSNIRTKIHCNDIRSNNRRNSNDDIKQNITMLNTNKMLFKKKKKQENKPLGNRGEGLSSLTSTTKSWDVPVDSDPISSFMASE